MITGAINDAETAVKESRRSHDVARYVPYARCTNEFNCALSYMSARLRSGKDVHTTEGKPGSDQSTALLTSCLMQNVGFGPMYLSTTQLHFFGRAEQGPPDVTLNAYKVAVEGLGDWAPSQLLEIEYQQCTILECVAAKKYQP